MTDIYDIKDILFGRPLNIFNSIIFIIFIIILVIYYKYFLNKKLKKEDFKAPEKKEVIKKDYLLILNEMESNYLDSDKNIFYSKLAEVLREILEEKNNKNISKMTFYEINKLDIDKNIKNLIKTIYYKEYPKEIIDSEKSRKELIEKVRGII